MSKLKWSKFNWSDHTKAWRSHPLWIEGAWIRVMEQLHASNTTGMLSRSIESWAMIIGCDKEETKEFLVYLKKNDLAEVKIEEDIKVSCNRMIREEKAANANAKRQGRYRDASPTEKRRKEALDEIRLSYHPKRRTLQPVLQEKSINTLMIETSKGLSGDDKIGAEDCLKQKILCYIESMKGTAEWENEGKYVQGLGNFLRSRAWELTTKIIQFEKIRKVENNKAEEMWG